MTNGTSPIVVSMQDLPQAAPASLTDEIIVCQATAGCDPATPLVRMTLQQLSDLIATTLEARLKEGSR
jgi:hypothetical protein